VFLNVAGGLKVGEPAADLAVAAALLSSLTGKPVPSDAVVFGEIGLSAEIRAVAHAEARLKEAAKLGFGRAILPELRRKKGEKASRNDGLSLATIRQLHDLVAMFQDEASVGRKAGEA
jgi:DNA repair protein RadA/Sms